MSCRTRSVKATPIFVEDTQEVKIAKHTYSSQPSMSLPNHYKRAAAWLAGQLLLVALLVEQAAAAADGSWRNCDSDMQVVMCGQIPSTLAYRPDRMACCKAYRPRQLPPEAQAAQVAAADEQFAMISQTVRGDLTTELAYAPNYYFGKCTVQQYAYIPTFQGKSVTIKGFPVPQLNKGMIQRVKARVYSIMPQSMKDHFHRVRSYSSSSGFIHPGATAGPMELAYMKSRLSSGNQIVSVAKDRLIYGTGVRPKIRYLPDNSTWAPPTNCPADGYYGPYPMQKVLIKWSGFAATGTTCPSNFPVSAFLSNCGHIAFVELDAQMAYKMALAWHITGDDRYANKVFQIVDAWSATNKEWGLRWENGPLEAAWGISAMARALELLRSKAPSGIISRFRDWVNAVPMKDMDYYADNAKGSNSYGNWHSSIAECFMALGVLADDRARYDKGVALFHATVQDYLKWGKGDNAYGRILGECTETMRDMYHAQFGLGGLLQAAEIAWQQDEDLYSSNGHALAAAMELHARITNAWLNNWDTDMLPSGFKYYPAMPQPPEGCRWQFDISRQVWYAVRNSDGSWHSEMKDKAKWLFGIGFLPTGWEVGYNHYLGRLGIKLPETAALLSKSWPEWQEFHWGLGTLTHAHTAQKLWRDGVKDYTLCGNKSWRNIMEAAQNKGQEQYIDNLAVLAKLMPNDTATAGEHAETELYMESDVGMAAAAAEASAVDRSVAASSYPVVREASIYEK